MADKHLLGDAKKFKGTDSAWWYEMKDGIDVVVQCHDQYGMYVQTKNLLIPWKQIRAAVERKGRK